MSSLSTILVLTAALAGIAVALALWTWLMWRLYGPRAPEPDPIPVKTRDGWTLAAFPRLAKTRRFEEPIILCHGLAANHRNLDFDPPWSLAQYLADAGFDCFSVDWRGTGRSRGRPPGRRWSDYSIDDHIREDGPAFLDAICAQTGARRAFWVGHSLGGLIGYAVAQGPHADKMAGLVTIGSPAYFTYPAYMIHLLRLGHTLAWPFALRQRLLSVMSAPWVGHVTLPLTDVVFNPLHIRPRVQRRISAQVLSSISRPVLLQFEDWLRHDAFRTRDGGTDFRKGLADLRLPLLVTGGSRDRLAPPPAVTKAFEAAGSTDKTLMIFGTENGDALDYGHGDLIFGEGAPTEVFPRIQSWLESHATPVMSDQRAAGSSVASGSNS